MVEYQKIFDRLPLRRHDQGACQGPACVPVYLCEQHDCSSTVSEDLSQDAGEKIELSVAPDGKNIFFLKYTSLNIYCWTQRADLLEPLSLTKSLTSCPLPSLGLIRT